MVTKQVSLYAQKASLWDPKNNNLSSTLGQGSKKSSFFIFCPINYSNPWTRYLFKPMWFTFFFSNLI